MPYTCPQCSKDDSLIVTAMIELLPDEWSDEIEVEIVECSCCRFRGVAVDEESRRGAPGFGVHPPRGLPRGGRGIRGVERRDQTLPRSCEPGLHVSVPSIGRPGTGLGRGTQGRTGIIGSGWNRCGGPR